MLSADWFRRHLLEELMPRWLVSSRTDNGLFRVGLDRKWRPVGEHTATLVSQSRLIYDFATAYALSDNTGYLSAVSDLADALLKHFRTRRKGAWRWAVTGDGRPADDRLSAYGHAFVIFGLSHACAATGNGAYRDAALETLVFVREAMGYRHGGFVAALDPDCTIAEGARTQNPIMHLFEALLALGYEVGSHRARQGAAEVGDWVRTHLIAPNGSLAELFTPDWRPLRAEENGRVDVGHQFEWAFLLSRAVELGLWTGRDVESVLAAGHQLLDAGMRLGYDAREGGVWSPASPAGVLLSGGKGWWEQCEAARAMLHYARLRGRGDLMPAFDATMGLCRRRLIDPEYGGWFMRVEPDDSVRNTDKGSVWKVDYHVVGLCTEAIRLLET